MKSAWPALFLILVCLGLALASPGAAFAADATVELTNPGSGARAVLRWKAVPDGTRDITLVSGTNMTMKLDDNDIPAMDMPAMVMKMRAKVIGVAADGTLDYAFEVTGIDVDHHGHGASGLHVDAMKQQLQGLVGLGGTTKMNALGAVLDAQVTLPPGADPKLAAAFDQVDASMGNMSAPFPVEPVGVGAVWVVAQSIDANGMKMAQKTSYELVSRDGNKVVLKTRIAQNAPPQDMQIPGLPPGASARLMSMTGGGQGTTELDLTHPMPTSATVHVKLSMVASFTADGQTHEMTTDMTSSATLTGQ